ncbi:hypothetical protein LTR17_005027 [Elasticomyces elasticus]|nr:hypothetical protein LTR17_005027 [Elasticomyces elasticus]
MASYAISLFYGALIFRSFATSTLAQQCYYPDGITINTIDTPCNASAEHSACCDPNNWCIGNGLCFGAGTLSRASCTDQDWGDSCGQYCTTTSNNGEWITACGPGGPFACGLNNSNCLDSTSTFNIDGGTNVLLRDFQLGQEQTAAAELSPNTNYTCGSFTDNATFTGTAGVQAATVTAWTRSNGHSTMDLAGAIVGVGAPLLLALAAAVFTIFRLRKKLREAEGWRGNGDNTAPRSYYADTSNYADTSKHLVAAPKQEEAIALVSELDAHRGRQELDAGK